MLCHYVLRMLVKRRYDSKSIVDVFMQDKTRKICKTTNFSLTPVFCSICFSLLFNMMFLYACYFLLGAALSSASKQLLLKTHGSSLRHYHLWLPLPIPLAMLRNYIKDDSGVQDSTEESNTESQEPDLLLNTLVNKVLTFFKLRDKDGGQDNNKN